MPELGVVIRSSEVKVSLLEAFQPDHWNAFENHIDQYLRQQLAGIGINRVQVDVAQSAHPGPLLLKFTVDSRNTLTAQQLKDVLKR
jgi:hypothetical protein